MTGGATAGSGRTYRLDPETLPVRSPAIAGAAGASSFIIENERVVVRTGPEAGPTATLSIPVNAYRGVSVRISPVGDAGEVCAHVELLHHNPDLTLPLLVSDDPETIENDWKAWGRALGLPLLLIGLDGSLIDPASARGLITGRPTPRRRHSHFAQRRPRFLTRRKVGHAKGTARLVAREIIARN